MMALFWFLAGFFLGWLVAVVAVVLNTDERNDSHQ